MAMERLQVIIARERNDCNNRDSHDSHDSHDFLPGLHKELIAVISKYTRVSPEDIEISLERQGNLEVIDINVTLPDV